MSLRRLPITAPLAFLVALLAHTATQGLPHAFGGPHGISLIWASPAALLVAALAIVLGSALGLRQATAEQSKRVFAVSAATFAGDLSVGGTLIYLGMERLEGHGGPALWTIAALGAAALLTATLALLSERALAQAGRALAVFFPTSRASRARLFVRLFPEEADAMLRRVMHRASRGRAPPHPA